MTRSIVRFLTLAFVATLIACSQNSSGSNGTASPNGPSATGASTAPGTAATQAVTGTASSQAPAVNTSALPGNAVPASQQTYNVTWNPQTKIIDAGTVKQTYRGVASDGTLTFDSSAAQIASLTPGSIVLFSNLALRKIKSVENQDGQLHVATEPVALDEAISNGHIGGQVAVDFSRLAYVTPPGFHRVDVAEDPSWFERLVADPALAGSGVHYEQKIKDWKVDLTLTPETNDLKIDLTAKKSVPGGGEAEVTGEGELDNLTSSLNVTVADGQTTQITFDNQQLQGNFDVEWSVALGGEPSTDLSKWNSPDVIKLPLGFSWPFLIGPIPFQISIGSGFAFAPVFSSKTTVAQGQYHASFGGAVNVDQGQSAGVDGSVQAQGEITSYGGTMSLAPLGLSVTLMAPKISAKVGAPEELESILGEQGGSIWAAFFVQANFIATGPVSIVACERRDLNIIARGGYEAGLLGQKLANKSWNFYTRNFSIIVPKNIKLCNPS